MNQHLVLFSLGQLGVFLQGVGSFLLLRQAFKLREFGGAESQLQAIGLENEVSIDAIGLIGMSLTREAKAQFANQLPGFAFLFAGMICQFVGNFSALI